jgi:hypothetical protein
MDKMTNEIQYLNNFVSEKKSTNPFININSELQLKISLQVPVRTWTRGVLGSPRCN